MAVPSHSDVDLALLVELVRKHQPVQRRETYDRVATHFPNLTPEDRAKTRKNGVTKIFHNLVNWSRNRMRVRGLLVDGLAQGFWQVNAEATTALIDDLSEYGVEKGRAETFIRGSDRLSDLLGMNWAKPLRSQLGGSEPDVPEAPAEPTPPSHKQDPVEQLDSRLKIRSALLTRMNAMSGSEFEQLIGRLLDSMGFRDTQVVGRSGDEGVDVLTYLDSPFIRAKVAVQVKRHINNVGPRDISYLRDRWARRADRLLFITTSDFTSGAREVADDDHDKQVELVNGEKLITVMIDHGFGVTVRPEVSYELDDTYFSN